MGDQTYLESAMTISFENLFNTSAPCLQHEENYVWVNGRLRPWSELSFEELFFNADHDELIPLSSIPF